MIAALFNHRTRGFRTINILAFAVLVVIALVVNLAKAYAGREVREIARTERKINEEGKRIRLLKAEVAHLEQPERLQRLAKTVLGMGPLSPMREGDINSLPAVAAGQTPTGPVPTPTPVSDTAVEEVSAVPVTADLRDAPAVPGPSETGQ
jgi:cell division protein FtsL